MTHSTREPAAKNHRRARLAWVISSHPASQCLADDLFRVIDTYYLPPAAAAAATAPSFSPAYPRCLLASRLPGLNPPPLSPALSPHPQASTTRHPRALEHLPHADDANWTAQVRGRSFPGLPFFLPISPNHPPLLKLDLCA